MPAFILALPNEMLCWVFKAVAREEMPVNIHHLGYALADDKLERVKALGFLRLSEVCTRFRAILLSMPDLMASVVFRLPKDPGMLALSRSGSAPLPAYLRHAPIPTHPTIYIKQEKVDADCERLVTLAVAHISRISSLTASNLEARDYQRIFSRTLPVLQDVVLIYGLALSASESPTSICIDAPALRSAHFVLWTDMFLTFATIGQATLTSMHPSLRTLDIHLMHPGRLQEEAVDLEWVPYVLQSLPGLETLKLKLDHFATDWGTAFDDRKVQLTHLRTFELECYPITDTVGLIPHICTSPLTRCTIKIFSSLAIPGVEGLHELTPAFGEALRPILQHPSYDGLLVRLETAHSHRLRLQVAAFPSINNFAEYSARTIESMETAVCLSVYIADNDVSFKRIMEILELTLTGNEFKQVVLEAPWRPWWSAALDPLVRVCTAARELVVLHASPHSYAGLPDIWIPGALPALDTVSVQPHYPGEQDEFGEFGHVWCEEFVAWLERRVQDGLRVRCARLLGPDNPDAKEFTDGMCARAAVFVDELSDERTAPL